MSLLLQLLSKLADVPEAQLQAMAAQKTFRPAGSVGQHWSLMGGNGPTISPELQARMTGHAPASYGATFGQRADRILHAVGEKPMGSIVGAAKGIAPAAAESSGIRTIVTRPASNIVRKAVGAVAGHL